MQQLTITYLLLMPAVVMFKCLLLVLLLRKFLTKKILTKKEKARNRLLLISICLFCFSESSGVLLQIRAETQYPVRSS